MITWMQKHKKYLVITIWISTIAFVGAGFVGWGAYDLNNKRATSVAQVGNRAVSFTKFNKAYGEAYNYYKSASGGKFSQEEAEKIGLDRMALARLIQEEMLLNFADDIGLNVSDSEISQIIANEKEFQENGVFNKVKYASTLKNMRVSAKEYENDLKERLLLNKLLNAIKIKSNSQDEQMLEAGLFMSDKLRAQVVTIDVNSLSPSEDELRKLWENSKDNYLTPAKYDLSVKFIQKVNIDTNESKLQAFYDENRGNYRDADDKILDYDAVKNRVKNDFLLKNTKRIALEDYLKIKKGEQNATEKMQVSAGDPDFPLTQVISAKIGEVIKPFEYKDGYLIAKLDNVIQPHAKDFEGAKGDVLNAYLETQGKKALENKAKATLSDFKGIDVGFVSRDSQTPILGLNSNEFSEFIDGLFANSAKKAYVLLDKKAIVYEIVEQKMLNEAKIGEFKELISQNVAAIKNEELQKDLLEALQKRYEIKQYYKGNVGVN